MTQRSNKKPISILSPLRYPGSKRRLADYVKQVVSLNELRPKYLIEPFAGGASITLQLLNDGVVEFAGINDLDPMVSAFWRTVFFDTDWLIEAIRNVSVTVENWYDIKSAVHITDRDKALACLFLNRTSFSGIIANRAGPIGGRKQASRFALDCRFPRETLVARIQQAQELRDRIVFVWNKDWRDAIRDSRQYLRGTPNNRSLLYLDPPFFEKADRLYNHYFVDTQHVELRDYLVNCEIPWVLSYDCPDRVSELYGGSLTNSANVELLYSTSGDGGMKRANEVVLSNLDTIPGDTRTWICTTRTSGLLKGLDLVRN